MSPAAPRIFLSAGDPSGDAHGAGVARALRVRWPGCELYGLAGPRMQSEGVTTLAPFDRLAVMGFAEVIRHLPFFWRLLRRVHRELDRRPPDLVLPIDYPGFNLRLARAAHERDVPVLYYIAPQVWAWHRSRMRELARRADRLAVVLPFEVPLFREAGADARFVGHPLLDTAPGQPDRASFCRSIEVDPARELLALFPGSRAQEVARHLDPFVEAATHVARERPSIQPVIAASEAVGAAAYADHRLPRTRDARGLLAHARAAIVKSGTSTLEAALAGVPMVVAYRTHPLTFWLARRLVDVEHVALANLVVGERLVPELLQHEATPARLADALAPLLLDGAQRRRVLDGLRAVRERLRSEDARSSAERVAELAAELLPAANA